MATIVNPCSCKSEFQDKTYGRGNRVFNEMRTAKAMKGNLGRLTGWRCTVCGNKKIAS